MDWVTWKQTGAAHLKKYQYVLLVLFLGILFMVLPEGKQPSPAAEVPSEPIQPDLQQSLSQILSRVEGAGKVEVLLTESAGARTLYQTDEDISSSDNTEDIRRDTVIISNAGREETGLVKQVLPPTFQGAIILCQGAGDARVRLAIVQAVMGVTGLGADNITVLKMK